MRNSERAIKYVACPLPIGDLDASCTYVKLFKYSCPFMIYVRPWISNTPPR